MMVRHREPALPANADLIDSLCLFYAQSSSLKEKESGMQDLLYVAGGVLCFALCWSFTKVCDRL